MYMYVPIFTCYVGGSLLLSSDQTDSSVSIDMDSVARRQQQMQIIEQQVHHMYDATTVTVPRNVYLTSYSTS